MNGFAAILKDYWGQLHLIPKGVWLLLISYGLVVFGSPMPPKITWLEILMGCGLLMGSILLIGLLSSEFQQQRSVKWCLGLTALLFLLPLVLGLIRGNALSDIARDIFPLTFLVVVPILLIYSASSANQYSIRTLIVTALVFVGICTAVTFFLGALNLVGSTDQIILMVQQHFAPIKTSQAIQASLAFQTSQASQLLLKIYDPSMLFTSIFLSAWGIWLMVKSWSGLVLGAFLLGAGALIEYVFMILGLRAYTVSFVLAILAVCLTMWRERGLYLRLLPLFFVACIALWPQIEQILLLLWSKQQIVGTNGKVAEWISVINLVFSSPQTALFGIGWGGIYSNPILNETTRFTHSAISFYLLKSGVLGLTTLLSIIVILIFQVRQFGNSRAFTTSRFILLVSCLPPLLIGVLLEPLYKMLSYGVILALLTLSNVSIRPERNRINVRK